MVNKIYNPKTKKWMVTRERTTSKGRRGQIISGYSPKAAAKVSQKFGRAIKKLSTQ